MTSFVAPPEDKINDQSSSGYVDIGETRICWGINTENAFNPTVHYPAQYSGVPIVTAVFNDSGSSEFDMFSVSIQDVGPSQFTLKKRFTNASNVLNAGSEIVNWMSIGLKP